MKSREELANEYQFYFDSVRWQGFHEEWLSVKKPYEMEKFVNDYHNFLRKFELELFENLMKIEWCDRQITYREKRKKDYPGRPGRAFNYALKHFYQRLMGYGRKIWNDGWLQDIRSYAEDLFPEFDTVNGFEFQFTFPFKYLTLEHLFCVSRVEHRMELLNEAEKRKLNIVDFHDYVAQYYSELKTRTGRNFTIYWGMSRNSTPYLAEKISYSERLRRKLLKKPL